MGWELHGDLEVIGFEKVRPGLSHGVCRLPVPPPPLPPTPPIPTASVAPSLKAKSLVRRPGPHRGVPSAANLVTEMHCTTSDGIV